MHEDYGQRGESIAPLKDVAEQIMVVINQEKRNGRRLEVHGNIIVLTDGLSVYALGMVNRVN